MSYVLFDFVTYTIEPDYESLAIKGYSTIMLYVDIKGCTQLCPQWTNVFVCTYFHSSTSGITLIIHFNWISKCFEGHMKFAPFPVEVLVVSNS